MYRLTPLPRGAGPARPPTLGLSLLLWTGCSSSPTESREQDLAFHLSGVVLSTDTGLPIPGARVELYESRLSGSCGFKGGGSGCRRVYHVHLQVEADEEGRFFLESNVQAISCLGFGLRGRAPGYQEAHQTLSLRACDGTPVDIQLRMTPFPPLPPSPTGTQSEKR